MEVVLVLVPPNFPTRKLILAQTDMMGGFSHLRVITQNKIWCNHGVRIIQMLLVMVLHYVLLMVMVKVMCVLVPPTSTHRKFYDI